MDFCLGLTTSLTKSFESVSLADAYLFSKV